MEIFQLCLHSNCLRICMEIWDIPFFPFIHFYLCFYISVHVYVVIYANWNLKASEVVSVKFWITFQLWVFLHSSGSLCLINNLVHSKMYFTFFLDIPISNSCIGNQSTQVTVQNFRAFRANFFLIETFSRLSNFKSCF